ncbi:MAG: hypothetical protein H0X50_10830 [Nitrosopumilus sp.]|nr:hypothetical protein [Nitrosopumilus sp.]
MRKTQTSSASNNNVDNRIEIFNCAGNGYYHRATNRLTILYLHKSGWLCDSCRNDLINVRLVEENE